METIRIVGARTHNLKNIDVEIPRGRLVVITGPSGSGKSSLAFDTVYAEGQRRYAEGLPAYARLVMGVAPRADVERIEGLTPTVAIAQAPVRAHPRCTVGTLSEINDFTRILFAKAGCPTCPTHGEKLRRDTVGDMVACALRLTPETKVAVLAPVAARFAGDVAKVLQAMRRLGFVRLRLDGEIVEVESLGRTLPERSARLEVVVDRLRVSDTARARLAESFEAACRLSEGRATLLDMETHREWPFNQSYGCPLCSYTFGELYPAMFSCNTVLGACPDCAGTGSIEAFDEAKLLADPKAPVARAFASPVREALGKELKTFAEALGISLDTPWEALSRPTREAFLRGGGDSAFEGVVALLQRRLERARSAKARKALSALRARQDCASCGGRRFKKEVCSVTLGEGEGKLDIVQFSRLPLSALRQRLQRLVFGAKEAAIAEAPLKEIVRRLGFLIEAGLGYLTLERTTSSLSGGELQRIRLAAALSAGLTGVTYVLDEPTQGLHPSETERLIGLLKRLVSEGNSVLVVEHDASVIRAADWVLDMGPGAGAAGGRIVCAGRIDELKRNPASLTGLYLTGKERVSSVLSTEDEVAPDAFIRIVGASGRNLKRLTCRIPIGCLTSVTGVSGSGKSTLLLDTLAATLRRKLHRSEAEALPYESIEGLEVFEDVLQVERGVTGGDARSLIATYTGVSGPLRELFAQTLAARERGYAIGRFTLSRPGGRCEACAGDGETCVDMGFLPSLYVPCPVCQGARFNRETLDVKFKGRSIADVYAMTIDEAADFFKAQPAIEQRLSLMQEIGLGYLRLGERLGALSGGEMQRIRLVEELCKRSSGKTLYVLDEPTSGLHFRDVRFLLQALRRLVQEGNTVVVIEHNLDVVASSDWVVDLGPEGGPEGGTLVAEGTPLTVAQKGVGQTARALSGYFNLDEG